jgi:hypothetical protein
MSSESPSGAGSPPSSLTRADIELLLRREQPAAPVDLSFQNLQHCNLSYLDLQGANLRGANLQGANLRGAMLSRADLREANLSGADLNGTDLRHAVLRGANLQGADLSTAQLYGPELREAIFIVTSFGVPGKNKPAATKPRGNALPKLHSRLSKCSHHRRHNRNRRGFLTEKPFSSVNAGGFLMLIK